MTQAIQTVVYQYNGSGSTGPFAYNAYVENSADIVVEKWSTTGVKSTLVLTTDYTLSTIPASSVNVTLVSALAINEKIAITRKNRHNQESYDPTTGGSLGLQTIEDMLDRYSRGFQDLWERDSRTLHKDARSSGSMWEAGTTPLELTETAAPSTPPSGKLRVYAYTDGTVHTINDAGTDTDLSGQAIAAAASAAAAASSANDAETAQTAAEAAQAAAEAAQTAAETAETNAETAETNAETAQAAAEVARDAAIAASENLAWGYTFDTGTTDADPGSGKLRFNHASFMSATEMYINETADEGDISAVMATWDDSTSTIKATVSIRNPLAPTNWFQFHATGTITDAGSYRKVTITPIATSGSVTNGTAVLMGVVRNGDAGTGAVDSFNGRSGPVTPASGDYEDGQITAAVSATNYTPSAAHVEGHLAGIDTAIGTRMAKASNLSDVVSAATAFGNIKQAATDSATGVVELATTAEAQAGSDTSRAITAAGLAAATVMQGKHATWIPASAIVPRTTNGAAAVTQESTTNDIMTSYLAFDATTSEGAGFWIKMPKSWDEGTVTFVPVWKPSAVETSQSVVWSMKGVALSDTGTIDTAMGTAQTSVDMYVQLAGLHFGPESSAITLSNTPNAVDCCYFEITRQPGDASDTITTDCYLLGVAVFLTFNAATDA